jgi:hypothetical protein
LPSRRPLHGEHLGPDSEVLGNGCVPNPNQIEAAAATWKKSPRVCMKMMCVYGIKIYVLLFEQSMRGKYKSVEVFQQARGEELNC